MPNGIDLAKFKSKAKLTDRYPRQLQRLQASGIAPACIEQAVTGAIANLAEAKTSSLVIYGEPQSGKTEMMICLTAKLLDDGHPVIVHLMNDSVDLLTQNLKSNLLKNVLGPPVFQRLGMSLDTGGHLRIDFAIDGCFRLLVTKIPEPHLGVLLGIEVVNLDSAFVNPVHDREIVRQVVKLASALCARQNSTPAVAI